ncbi:MAG: Gldg family protein [Bacteroidetes bacterium]|nr:Gldg family protein [Bacteroidota bacterium]MBL6944417.1 Gldg family protein [Bacteroidales bacterium]
MNKKSYTTSALLLIVSFIVIVIISEKYFVRLDLSEGGQYSLSDATKKILKNLDTPVTVTAYFTKDLPPDLDKVKRNFKDMLIEYNSLSDGNVVFKFENPNENKEVETDALSAGVQPVLFKARDKDEVKQQKVFMGAVLLFDNKKEIIPFINPEGSIEYALTTAIKKLTVTNKALIGFVQGQGEPPLTAYQQVKADLDVLYNVKEVYLSDTVRNINKFQTLVISAPTQLFNYEAIEVLDSYISNGGNLFVAFNRMSGNLQTLQGESNETGFEIWLANKGLLVDSLFLVDANCGSVNVSQQTGRFNMTTPVKFPFLPAITNFADFPVTKGLEQIMLGFPSPIRYVGDTTTKYTPLAMSSKNSGLLSLPVVFNVQKNWTVVDFQSGEQVVAAMLECNYDNNEAKIIVVSSGDFAVNGTGQRPRQLQPDNVSLMVNSIDWLSDDTGLIDLRTKTITSRPIDQISDSKKVFIKWLNFLLPVLLVIIYGFIRIQMRRNQRMKRMHEGYVK